MEIVVLFAILALLIFGPRRGGRWPGRGAIALGAILLAWLAVAFGAGSLWRAIVGDIPQP